MHKSLRNILIVLSLFAAGVAHAQTVDPVQYIVAPETPGPNAPVTITVQGVGTFLGDADITWSVNGAVAKEGTGASNFTFTTGGLGTQSSVRVSIDSASQGLIVHTFTFVPSTVDLVWEANTSVPPLYPGHALYSAGSPLTVVAFPTVIIAGKKVAPASLSYQWQINDNPQTGASGTGKYFLSYTGDQLQDSEQVSVDVYFGTLKVGHGAVAIPASAAQLLLYNKDALRGVVWDRVLPAQIALNAKEITVFAQPYFFANPSLGNLSWSWSLGDSPVTGPDSDRGILTLRQTGSGQGSTQLAASVQNLNTSQLVQSAQTALSIFFGQQAGGLQSIFGL